MNEQPPSNQPSYPQYPQPSPQQAQPFAQQGPHSYAAPQVVYQRSTSFTNKAVIAFLLYWLGYIPGLIFNIMYLNEANNVKREIGRTPEGMGCLWATLIGSLAPAVLFIAICAMLGVFGAAGGQH